MPCHSLASLAVLDMEVVSWLLEYYAYAVAILLLEKFFFPRYNGTVLLSKVAATEALYATGKLSRNGRFLNCYLRLLEDTVSLFLCWAYEKPAFLQPGKFFVP